jgi:hypothetical protein
MTVNIRGYEVLIDDEDYEFIKAHNWQVGCPSKLPYFWFAKRNKEKRNHYALHRLLLNAPEGSVVDHINGNTLDNRKANLRITDWKGNARNHCLASNNTSGYRGVIYSKSKNRWRAVIQLKNHPLQLGYYPSKEIAAYVYEEASKIVFGEYYRDLNVSPEITIPTWHIAPCKAQKNGRGWFSKIKFNSYPHYMAGYETEAELQEAYKKLRAEIDIRKSLENANDKIRKIMGITVSSEKIKGLADILKPKEREPMQFVCKNCGKIFFSMKYHARCCCKKCAQAFYYKEKRVKHIHKCLYCGKEFTGMKKRRFCNRRCSNRSRINNRRLP